MSSHLAEIFRRHCRPLEPQPTGESPVLRKLSEVRAVLFDLYGTLLVSGSGEVGTDPKAACQSAVAEALVAVGVDASRLAGDEIEILFETIKAEHARRRGEGIEYPEVQIDRIWGEVLRKLVDRGVVDGPATEGVDCRRLAVEYEARANPVWPMPGVESCLERLRDAGVSLGIVSNAQFYTRLLLPALLARDTTTLGFDPRLEFYSYEHGLAKPGTDLYRMAAEELKRRGVEPGAVLLVGNDLLNDVTPAFQVGFRTALFAGDARSLRWRKGDPRVDGVRPDLVLTRLPDLAECIMME